MHRRPIVIANWKMYPSAAESLTLARRMAQHAAELSGVEVVILPPIIWLPTILESLPHRPGSLQFGVQNFYPKEEGALTGEIGLKMIEPLVRFVLVGHSERRTILAESPELINQKVQTALRAGLNVLLCVGELTKVMVTERHRGRPTILERESDLIRQLASALNGVGPRQAGNLIICYEPLWAIGTGNHVSGAHAQAVLSQLRRYLKRRFGTGPTSRIRTVYGGSVTPGNVSEYVRQPDIDGVLVGTASLEVGSFLPIVAAFAEREHHLTQHRDH